MDNSGNDNQKSRHGESSRTRGASDLQLLLEVHQTDYDFNKLDLDDELEEFRKNWQSELVANKVGIKREDCSAIGTVGHQTSDERYLEALDFFRRGIVCEQLGKLYDAVINYRRATQMVPDIEFRFNRQLDCLDQTALSKPDNSSQLLLSEDNNNDDALECDLVSKFLKLNTDDDGNLLLCHPQTEQFMAHFSSLPYEVIIYILKWVVSNELDLRSLEQFARVCRGFYIVARDPEIWKLACHKTWGVASSNQISNFNGNWRLMFIDKPRLNWNGAYISKTTYIRQGEASFQDYGYRPCHLVEYFRYLRFFPDGFVMMLTTPDDPYQSLPSLRQRNSKNPNVLKGHFNFSGSVITAVFQREVEGQNYRKFKKFIKREKNFHTFHLKLEVKSIRGKRNVQLSWKDYWVRLYGQEVASRYEISSSAFPPFWFSRVKSFVCDSESALCY